MVGNFNLPSLLARHYVHNVNPSEVVKEVPIEVDLKARSETPKAC